MKIGSHVSFSKKGLFNAAKEAASYGATAFMVYTGAPQNTRRKPIEQQFVREGKELMKQEGLVDFVVHAPYIINLGTFKDEQFEFAVRFLQEEIHRTHYMGAKQIVLHPGSYTERSVEYGISRIAEGLNQVLDGVKETDVQIALETMAGKGTEIGRNFEEIAAIIDRVHQNDRLSICIDTCHLHEAGYDIIQDFDAVLHEFDQIIGLDRLAVVHLNDSKNLRGARKDRHAPIGAGTIGFEAIYRIVHHDAIRELPLILETPWVGKEKRKKRPLYKAEIACLQGNVNEAFGQDYLEDVERLSHFFREQEIDPSYVSQVWTALKTNPKAKKEDAREPLDRLYDMVWESKLLPDLNEEQIYQRLVGWFAARVIQN